MLCETEIHIKVFIIHELRNALRCILSSSRICLLSFQASARNLCCLKHMWSDPLKNPWSLDPGMRWSAIAKFPASWRFTTEPTLYELKITTWAFYYFLGNIELSPKIALHPRWISGTNSATQTPVIECPYFRLWDSRIACMLLKKPVLEASLRAHAPAAASETCLWGPRLGTAPSFQSFTQHQTEMAFTHPFQTLLGIGVCYFLSIKRYIAL